MGRIREYAREIIMGFVADVRSLHAESGGAVMFVLAMLTLYCGVVVAGVVLGALGDYGLILAALKSAAIIAPAMGAARVVLAIVRTKPIA